MKMSVQSHEVIGEGGSTLHHSSTPSLQMKYVDDYSAKLEIWAREGKVCHMPAITNLPRFGHRKFKSHAEMNAWKRELLGQLAERGGAKWRK
jgi:hypothetical protein